MNFNYVEKNIERATGLSVARIRDMSPEDARSYFERKNHHSLIFSSEFPVIGRGNVLHDSLIDSQTLNKEIDNITI